MRGLLSKPCGKARRDRLPEPVRTKKTKRRRIESMDRLSHLSDDLLSLILSRLPIKDAVRTAVLSRRFRHAPSLLRRTDFLRITAYTPVLDAEPGLLRRCDIVRFPRSTRAFYAHLVQNALDRGVQELALHDRAPSRAAVSSAVLVAASLRVLSLDHCSLDNTPRVALPLLRTLKLERVSLCEQLFERIVESCPVLERLHVVYCSGMGAYNVLSASVKHLWIEPSAMVSKIEVDAPRLDTLTLYTRPRMHTLSLRGPRVRKVYINLASPLRQITRRLEEFLAAAEGLNCLTLRGASLKCLSLGKNISAFPVPFHKLRILSLSGDVKDDFQVSYVVKLLESCPHLRELNISVAQGCLTCASTDLDKYVERLRQLKCIKRHLEQVKICGSTSEVFQVELARIFLTKAKKLKKMTLQLPKNCSSDQLTTLKDVLSLLKKASIQRTSVLGSYYRIQIEFA